MEEGKIQHNCVWHHFHDRGVWVYKMEKVGWTLVCIHSSPDFRHNRILLPDVSTMTSVPWIWPKIDPFSLEVFLGTLLQRRENKPRHLEYTKTQVLKSPFKVLFTWKWIFGWDCPLCPQEGGNQTVHPPASGNYCQGAKGETDSDIENQNHSCPGRQKRAKGALWA